MNSAAFLFAAAAVLFAAVDCKEKTYWTDSTVEIILFYTLTSLNNNSFRVKKGSKSSTTLHFTSWRIH